ncbi:MAG: pseudouridine synthase [Planctomycetota bacterium]
MDRFHRPHGGSREARVSIARALSKLGVCSRSEGEQHVAAGRVTVNGRTVHDRSLRVDPDRDLITLDGTAARAAARIYLMLNKPRGLVTTTQDEKGRETVYARLKDARLPRVSAVGRLDMASEGLLLFTNDTQWANRLMNPDTHVPRTYHVQVDAVPDEALLEQLRTGVDCGGERLHASAARILRQGEKNAWLEIVLDEGRNRQIRRMLEAFGLEARALVRVAIGDLCLGGLAKGDYRHLTPAEVRVLGGRTGKEPS